MQLTIDLQSIVNPALDGGGLIIIGGHVIRVPPAGPGHDLVEHVGRYLGTERGADTEATVAIRRSLPSRIAGTVADLHRQAEGATDAVG